jgi:tetratricopeptide (TPR) repeat protein
MEHRHPGCFPSCLSLLLALAAAVSMLVLGMGGCGESERASYQSGLRKMQARDYQGALDRFDYSLKQNPDSKSALYRKAYCLYKLGRHAEAKPLFEDFLRKTDNNEWTATFIDERRDAAFYRDKCKEALGEEVPQNQEAIPEPPMGE